MLWQSGATTALVSPSSSAYAAGTIASPRNARGWTLAPKISRASAWAHMSGPSGFRRMLFSGLGNPTAKSHTSHPVAVVVAVVGPVAPPVTAVLFLCTAISHRRKSCSVRTYPGLNKAVANFVILLQDEGLDLEARFPATWRSASVQVLVCIMSPPVFSLCSCTGGGECVRGI